jgi:hypothetical protein
MITNNFGIDFRKDCVMFKLNKTTYKIPSKIYPLNSRKYHVFTNSNTESIKNEDIKKLFNLCKFELARCYSNAEMLRQGAEILGIKDIKYYSGWLFVGDKLPMHHAWIVYNDKSILDGSMLQDLFTMLETVEDKNKLTKREHANLMKKSLSSNKPNHEKFCFGKVLIPIIYIGCETDCDYARELYNKAIEATNNNHPSYPHMKHNAFDYSQTQKMIKGLI